MGSLTVDIVVTVLAALAYAVALTGIVVPVLPGTITYVVATLVWAIVIGGWTAWIAFAVILVLGALGLTASYVLTGRRLKQHEVPTWPILVGIAAGIVGIFVIPLLGLPIGFLAGLYVAESLRLKDWKDGLSSTWIAIKALGTGIAIELGLGFLSTIVLVVAAVIHFVTV